MRHPSPPAERVTWIGTLLAEEGEYGAITAVSRASGASRPTRSAWRERARTALTALWTEPSAPGTGGPAQEVAILTLVLEAHASTRGIQTCLRDLLGWRLSLGQIGTVIREAATRAVACLARSVPAQPRALARDELYGNAHAAAYLSAVDAHGGAVWATAGPVEPDARAGRWCGGTCGSEGGAGRRRSTTGGTRPGRPAPPSPRGRCRGATFGTSCTAAPWPRRASTAP